MRFHRICNISYFYVPRTALICCYSKRARIPNRKCWAHVWPNCIFNSFAVFALRIPMQATRWAHSHTHVHALKSGLTISVELTIKSTAVIFGYSHFKCTSAPVFVGMRTRVRVCVLVYSCCCWGAHFQVGILKCGHYYVPNGPQQPGAGSQAWWPKLQCAGALNAVRRRAVSR